MRFLVIVYNWKLDNLLIGEGSYVIPFWTVKEEHPWRYSTISNRISGKLPYHLTSTQNFQLLAKWSVICKTYAQQYNKRPGITGLLQSNKCFIGYITKHWIGTSTAFITFFIYNSYFYVYIQEQEWLTWNNMLLGTLCNFQTPSGKTSKSNVNNKFLNLRLLFYRVLL